MKKVSLLILSLILASCMSESKLKESVKKIIKEDPSIVISAIDEKPAEFVEALQKAVQKSQFALAQKRDDEEKKKLEDSYKNPLKPEIRADEAIRGPKDAPLTLVEYSDFECPFCSKGFETVMAIMNKFPGKVRFVYKHLPLSFHQQAMISAQYYEAIRIQSPEKAFKFHDEIFKNQRKLKNGEAFLKEIAKQVGADMKKLSSDLNSEAVKTRIAADEKEAAAFGFQGTPGFLLNGIPVKGAYPLDHFEGIVAKLKEMGTVSI